LANFFYSHQESIPGKQSEMPHEALEEYLPGPDGKPELYKAAGKLKGKKGMCNYYLVSIG